MFRETTLTRPSRGGRGRQVRCRRQRVGAGAAGRRAGESRRTLARPRRGLVDEIARAFYCEEVAAGVGWRRGDEAQLAAAWQQRRYPPDALVDSLGRHLRVVFAGRRWGGPGPDFQGALIALPDGTLLRGDVEVHRRASGWAAHRHALDPRYSRVILHVVSVVDAPTLDPWGAPIPTLALPAPTVLALPALAPCLRQADDLARLVAEAGRERFRARAARFEGDLEAASPDQVLWRGVAEALGFSHNVAPFARLADAAPWDVAARVAREYGEPGVAALLLGTAGLLDACAERERALWETLGQTIGAGPGLPASAWERTLARPANDPAARCRGLAALTARWADAGPGAAERVLAAVDAAGRERRPRLWPLLAVRPWIGPGRAQTIVVNVLLPFAAAAGLQGAVGLYERLPGEPANRVTRYMAAQLGMRGVSFRTACERQGLLHLFKRACASRACEACPAADPALLPALSA